MRRRSAQVGLEGCARDEHPVTSVTPFMATSVLAVSVEGTPVREVPPAYEAFVVLAVVVQVRA